MTRVVVAGAGGCGLLAAAVLAPAGVEVLVLEKTDRVGGGTALSHQALRAAGTRFQRELGIEDGPSGYAGEILARNGGSEPELTRRLADVSARMVEYVAAFTGVDMYVDGFSFGQRAARSHRWRSDRPITDHLHDALVPEPGVEIRFTTVTDLIVDDGAVTGVETGDGPEPADFVILASGGFAGSREMLQRHIPKTTDIPFPGHHGSTGDGIEMGLRAGGVAVHMDSFQPYPAHVGPGKRGMPPDVIVSGGIVVDHTGARFVDETDYPGGLARAILDLPGQRAWEIFDREILAALPAAGGERSVTALIDEGLIRQAGDAVRVGELLGIDGDGLAATIAGIGGSLDHPDGFGRVMTRGLVPPLYGIGITVAIYHTQGGLRVDGHGRVLRGDGTPIPGLYAGGGAATGISGDGPGGYLPGNGLLASLGLGFLAAEHILESTGHELAGKGSGR